MNERPIIYSAAMILALLEKRKWQTRRIVKLPKWSTGDWSDFEADEDGCEIICASTGCSADINCPYGTVGDRLWVRETFFSTVMPQPSQIHGPDSNSVEIHLPDHRWAYVTYRATYDPREKTTGWTPSIYMPHWASRLTYEITRVRLQRVQEISEADAVAEGIMRFIPRDGNGPTNEEGYLRPLFHHIDREHATVFTAREAYAQIWDQINGKKPGCSWTDNPWVWVLDFKAVAA